MDCRQVRFIVDSELKNVSGVSKTINRLCSLASLDKKEAFQIELCVVEAVNNSLIHGYEKESGHQVEIIFSLYPDNLSIDICDTGKPFDVGILKEKKASILPVDDKNINEIPAHGRGLTLMHMIMDDIKFKTDGKKKCFTLIKRRTSI